MAQLRPWNFTFDHPVVDVKSIPITSLQSGLSSSWLMSFEIQKFRGVLVVIKDVLR